MRQPDDGSADSTNIRVFRESDTPTSVTAKVQDMSVVFDDIQAMADADERCSGVVQLLIQRLFILATQLSR